jgi:hypothetical protein
VGLCDLNFKLARLRSTLLRGFGGFCGVRFVYLYSGHIFLDFVCMDRSGGVGRPFRVLFFWSVFASSTGGPPGRLIISPHFFLIHCSVVLSCGERVVANSNGGILDHGACMRCLLVQCDETSFSQSDDMSVSHSLLTTSVSVLSLLFPRVEVIGFLNRGSGLPAWLILS